MKDKTTQWQREKGQRDKQGVHKKLKQVICI